jgi:hypothetical protein
MKKIIIAGGTGFLGVALRKHFEKQGIVVITLSRKRTLNTTYWNGIDIADWKSHLEEADVLINLAGKSVDCRYTPANKQAILSSRIDSTRILNEAVAQCKTLPKVFLNASTATIYVHSETQLNTEENGIIGDNFSMNIAKSWEQEFFSTQRNGVRKVALRTSIVLGNEGGALPKMKLITKLGMGAKQGRGNQMVSWIHITDFCRALDFVIHSELSGPINITAPEPLRNKEFTTQLRKSMNIPFGISQRAWVLELGAAIIGTETELLLKSRYVYPQRLVDAGFRFCFKDLKSCLNSLTS